ncbi:hypothetical protein [Methanosphaera sp.]|uniref:hypothetical protein n=1 Tax=Methanosphaera sp. TaxID=2666342 RepID=UPI002E7A27D4|nr:hypothetical protein [Methanosphaera sp.]MEE1117776.1 hypothetical protein [Methanosphaera sp.]
MVSDEPLKLVLKCIDHEEFGNLYAFNKEITDEEKDLVMEYFRKYKPIDFKDIMNIEGNPHGWMCLEKNVPKVEEKLGITETLEQQRIKNEQLQKELNAKRKIKDEAMAEIERIFQNAPRPNKFLKKLLKKADIVYDPGDGYYTDHEFGEGQLFILESSYIWYIINNGRKDDDYSLNNIKTTGPGAVGFRISYDEHVHDLIKLVSDENIYKG